MIGKASDRGVAATVQVSPRLSLHTEYSGGRDSSPAPGSIPASILDNVVPATARIAGVRHGIERHRVKYSFAELVGVNAWSTRRVDVTLLAGFGLQAEEESGYYDAYVATGTGTQADPRRYVRLPGQYSVLNFETPSNGLVLGANASIELVRHLLIVPTIRYQTMGDLGSSMTAGVGASVRF